MKIKISKFILVIFLIIPLFGYHTTQVFAACPPDCVTSDEVKSSSGSTVNLTNPISSDSIPALIGRVITAVLGVVGSIALLMVIYGGFTWMLAAGNSEKIKKGRDIIVWAMLGLVVIFTSYALVRFVITSI